ncbi:MAG TPA: hypothetical protein VMT45_00200 [Thermoanaerobaculaceae bacterium]|nr:hypothetical protein [Thermoanaerobaculaceae bacterium]
MSTYRAALRARRACLQERAASERAETLVLLDQWATRLHAMDRGLSLIRTILGSVLIGFGVGAGMAALAITRPRGIRGWIDGGRAVWRLLGTRPLDLWLACHPEPHGRPR